MISTEPWVTNARQFEREYIRATALRSRSLLINGEHFRVPDPPDYLVTTRLDAERYLPCRQTSTATLAGRHRAGASQARQLRIDVLPCQTVAGVLQELTIFRPSSTPSSAWLWGPPSCSNPWASAARLAGCAADGSASPSTGMPSGDFDHEIPSDPASGGAACRTTALQARPVDDQTPAETASAIGTANASAVNVMPFHVRPRKS